MSHFTRKFIKSSFLLVFIMVGSCKNDTINSAGDGENMPSNHETDSPEKPKVIREETPAKNTNKSLKTDSTELSSPYAGLVDIQTINPLILVELKYATTDNFMKVRLYDTLTKAYLQKEVAIRLGKCQEYLTSIDKNLFLLVYDAVRPVSVQRKMWDGLDTIPVAQRGKFVSNPANGSIHNYGAAVDLTISNKKGIPLDMGAGYDDIRKIAYPSLEAQFLKNGDLTIQQVENRKLLRKVMANQGFTNIPTEWWHFNAFSRNVAKSKFRPLN